MFVDIQSIGMAVTSFSRLAPHRGLTPVMGIGVGNSDMHGGFSWGGLFSGISSGLNRVGNFLGNTARQIGNSQAFQQVKSGVLQSGVLENAGNLAGTAVSGLVDVGRLKLERDLQRLRDKAAGISPTPVPPPRVSQPVYDPPVVYEDVKPESTVDRFVPPPQVVEPVPAPLPPAVQENPPVEAVPLGPYIPPEQATRPSVSGRRPRKRRRTSGWGAALNGMMGYGPNFYERRYCL